MLVTTYRHDYVSPHTKRYAFLKAKNEKDLEQGGKEPCQCVEDKQEVPKAVEKQCAIEWTGVAPMGRLIDARIIPTTITPEQLDAMANDGRSDCFKEQPNRFLKILRTAYPDLYERLKQMPKDELNRRLERERMFTTYQIDYCNVDEYPEGIYKSLNDEDETKKLNANKLLQHQDACAEFRANVMQEISKDGEKSYMQKDPCEKIYKPFKISFGDSARFINSGNNSHWRTAAFKKRANFTEYMDSISRVGCVIMRNNIHNHQKCSSKHCRHQLVHNCNDMGAV